MAQKKYSPAELEQFNQMFKEYLDERIREAGGEEEDLDTWGEVGGFATDDDSGGLFDPVNGDPFANKPAAPVKQAVAQQVAPPPPSSQPFNFENEVSSLAADDETDDNRPHSLAELRKREFDALVEQDNMNGNQPFPAAASPVAAKNVDENLDLGTDNNDNWLSDLSNLDEIQDGAPITQVLEEENSVFNEIEATPATESSNAFDTFDEIDLGLGESESEATNEALLDEDTSEERSSSTDSLSELEDVADADDFLSGIDLDSEQPSTTSVSEVAIEDSATEEANETDETVSPLDDFDFADNSTSPAAQSPAEEIEIENDAVEAENPLDSANSLDDVWEENDNVRPVSPSTGHAVEVEDQASIGDDEEDLEVESSTPEETENFDEMLSTTDGNESDDLFAEIADAPVETSSSKNDLEEETDIFADDGLTASTAAKEDNSFLDMLDEEEKPAGNQAEHNKSGKKPSQETLPLFGDDEFTDWK